jgi:hypothetical protein
MSKLDLSSLNESKIKKKSSLKTMINKKEKSPLSGKIHFDKKLKVKKGKNTKDPKYSDSDSRDLESRENSASTMRTLTNKNKNLRKPPVQPGNFNLSLPTGHSR